MMRRPRTFNVLATLVVVGIVFAAGYAAGFLTFQPITTWLFTRAYEKKQAKFLNKPAPDFESATVDGKAWRLSDQRGKVVVIDFMASWCAPCIGSYPILKRIHERYSPDQQVVVVGVSLDEEREALEAHLEVYDIPWATLYEPGKTWDNSVARLYQIHGIPSVWIIDQQGRVVTVDASGGHVEEVVKELAESPPPEEGATG
jgi:thiol-disulfide isomerase/thioredoxin